MTEIEQFIRTSIQLERNSALRYDELADAINGLGAQEVVKFFRLQALLSRRHMQQAQTWAGFRENWTGTGVPEPEGGEQFVIEDGESAENTPIWVADGFVALQDAMAIALQTEEAAYNYYAEAAAKAKDPEVRTMALEFATEEQGHMNMVKAMLGRIKETS